MLWNIHVRTVQLSYRRAPEQPEGAFQVHPQYVDSAFNARFPGSGQAIGVRATAQHRASSHAERLHDVATATNTPVHKNFDATLNGLYDFRQSSQRGGNAIELPATMIRS